MPQALAKLGSRAAAVLVLSAAVLVVCLSGGLESAHASYTYGQLCAAFESDTDPYACDLSDPYGGNVFGAFQMSAGNAIAYARELAASSNATKAKYGKALVAAYKKDGNKCTAKFGAAWKAAFPGDAEGYLSSQYSYVKKAYYTPAASQWKAKASGFSASNYSTALKNVIFSTAVQHGTAGSASIFSKAMDNLGGYSADYPEDKVIAAIYAERARHEPYSTLKARVSGTVYKITSTDGGKLAKGFGLIGQTLTHFYSNPGIIQAGVYNRLASREPAMAFALYEKSTGKKSYYDADSVQKMAADPALDATTCPHAHQSGGVVSGYGAMTDANHVEHVTAVVCDDCSAVLEPAHDTTVANVYVQKGKSYKDKSGWLYTVHGKAWYQTTTELNLRSGRSASSAVLKVLPTGKAVKARSYKMGADGFWWGKVKTGGKSGYVQMRYLSRLGDASGVHSHDSAGVCKYCSTSAKVLSRMKTVRKAIKAGKTKRTLAKAVTAYKNAYKKASAKVKSYKAGKKVTVVKVVKNRYNDYWAKLADGSYLRLSALK